MTKKIKNTLLHLTPDKFPVFYGYIILLGGTLGVFTSLPGQTVGVSTFTDPVKDAMGLTRDQISVAYFVGTFLSSLFLGKAGKWFDKFGARTLATFSALGLSLSLFLCSKAAVTYSIIKNATGINHYLLPACIMAILFFMLRFSGQGVLTLASRNMIMKWFDRLRGRVNAFSSIVVSLGFSASPLWISNLIDRQGWQGAWSTMSIGVFIAAGIYYLVFRDNPEEFNMLPDGRKLSIKNDTTETKKRKQFTLQEAVTTRAFWMYSLVLSFYAFFITGLTFHVVSIFDSAGYTKDDAVAIFVPISIVSVSVSLIGNYISDFVKLKILLYLMILGGVITSVGIIFLSAPWGLYLAIGGAGIMSGLFTVLIAVSWPRFFGRKYLGAISGKTMSMMVLASALGPSLFSFSKTLCGAYTGISIASIVFLICVSITSLKAHNPQ